MPLTVEDGLGRPRLFMRIEPEDVAALSRPAATVSDLRSLVEPVLSAGHEATRELVTDVQAWARHQPELSAPALSRVMEEAGLLQRPDPVTEMPAAWRDVSQAELATASRELATFLAAREQARARGGELAAQAPLRDTATIGRRPIPGTGAIEETPSGTYRAHSRTLGRSDEFQTEIEARDALARAHAAEGLGLIQRPAEAAALRGELAPARPPRPLNKGEVRAELNRQTSAAGLDHRVHYVEKAADLPAHLVAELTRQGRAQTAQTVYDHNLGELWVIGEKFNNAADLHRALIEELIPRAFEGLRFPTVAVDAPNDPRLGWWSPTSEQAVVNTAALANRAHPLADASKTAVHEAVVHGGFSQLFANTLEGRETYVTAMRQVRRYFDSTGISQQLARSRGWDSLEAMTSAYAREYGRQGKQLQHLVTEELLGIYAEDKFPTRASLDQAPNWFHNILGRLGSGIRRALGWRVSHWDVEQLLGDSYAAVRPEKEPLGIGAIPIHPEAIQPDRQAISVLDVRPVTDSRLANIGHLEIGRKLSQEEADQLYARLEGAGNPVGVINRPDGPLFVNYDERSLPNHAFQALIGDAVSDVLGGGHHIELARNQGHYASSDTDPIARSNQFGAGRQPVTAELPQRYGREFPPTTAEAALAEARRAAETAAGGRAVAARSEYPGAAEAARLGAEPERAGGIRPEMAVPPGTERDSGLGVAGPGTAGVQARGDVGAVAPEPLRGEYQPSIRGLPETAREGRGAEPGRGEYAPGVGPGDYNLRETYERASLPGGGGGGPPEDLPSAQDELIRQQLERTAAGLRPGEALRQGAINRAMGRAGGPYSERLAAARADIAAYEVRPWEKATQDAEHLYAQHGNNPWTAANFLRDNPDVVKTDTGAALRKKIGDEADTRIAELHAQGYHDQADRMQAAKEQLIRDMAPRETELAQALNAQKLFYQDANAAAGRYQAGLERTQAKSLSRRTGVEGGYSDLQALHTRIVSQKLDKAQSEFAFMQDLVDKLRSDPKVLSRRYLDALSQEILRRYETAPVVERDAVNQLLAEIRELVRRRVAEMAPSESQPRVKISETSKFRDMLASLPVVERAWHDVTGRLVERNPALMEQLARGFDAPLSQQSLRALMRENGVNLRELAQKHYSDQLEAGRSLADELTRNLNISEDDARRVQASLDHYMSHVLRDEQARQVKQIMDQVAAAAGARSAPHPTELDRLIKYLNLGMLDKAEYYNALAPSFNLPAWTEAGLAKIRAAGDVLQQVIHEGGPHFERERLANEISDSMAQMQPGLSKAARQAQSIWMASLLTGPFTHFKYWIQNGIQANVNLLFRTLPAVIKGDLSGGEMAHVFGTYFQTLAHAINVFDASSTFRYTMSTGLNRFRAARAQQIMERGGLGGLTGHRGALEATPIPWQRGLLSPLNLPLFLYRYTPRLLSAMEGVFQGSAEAALMRYSTYRLADEHGMSPEEAHKWSDQVILGTEADQAEARGIAQSEAEARVGTDRAMSKADINRRVDELIAIGRTKRAASLEGVSADDAEHLMGEADRFALHSTYRESPFGGLGWAARAMQEARNKNPLMTVVTPFINLPANVANEFLNWSPLGMWRAGARIGGRQFGGIEALYKDVPGFDITKLSDREKTDLYNEFMLKGVVGTIGLAAGIMGQIAGAKNPNPGFWVHGNGPQNKEERNAWLATGARPYSIKLGDRYLYYDASPFKGLLSMIGSIGDYYRYDTTGTESQRFHNTLGSTASLLALSSMSSITDATFLSGLSDAFSILSGHTDQEKMDRAANWIGRTIATGIQIPMGGTLTRQLYTMGPVNPTLYESHDFGSHVLQSVPILNAANLQPRLNALGENITHPTEERLLGYHKPDPLWRAISEHNISVSAPSFNKTVVDGQHLNPQQFLDYGRARGQALRASLTDLFSDPEFFKQDPDEIKRQVQRAESDATETGKDAVREKYNIQAAEPNNRGASAQPAAQPSFRTAAISNRSISGLSNVQPRLALPPQLPAPVRLAAAGGNQGGGRPQNGIIIRNAAHAGDEPAPGEWMRYA